MPDRPPEPTGGGVQREGHAARCSELTAADQRRALDGGLGDLAGADSPGLLAPEALYENLVAPFAEARGAWHRGWHRISLDGTTLDVAGEQVNDEAFGCPRACRGRSSYPQLRFASLLECGTHGLLGAQVGSLRDRRERAGPPIDRALGARDAVPGRSSPLQPRPVERARRPPARPHRPGTAVGGVGARTARRGRAAPPGRFEGAQATRGYGSVASSRRARISPARSRVIDPAASSR